MPVGSLSSIWKLLIPHHSDIKRNGTVNYCYLLILTIWQLLPSNAYMYPSHYIILIHVTVRPNLPYPVLEKQFHRPCPWLQSSRLKTRLKSRYRWRLSTSGSLQIRCSTERTFVRTMSSTWVRKKVRQRWGRESDRGLNQACDNDGN